MTQATEHHREAGKKVVVIVGAGFAGLSAAKALERSSGLQVILIDQRNHHLFQPLLYQVATAGLNPADIAAPIRSQFEKDSNVRVHMEKVEGVDLANKKVIAADGHPIAYDFLILACGAQHSYFGHSEWEDFAPGLKTIEQATEIRRRILIAYENAENEIDPVKQNELLTFVIVGGGPTGIEMAGAIADISRTVLTEDFKGINTRSTKVVLVEAGDRILGSFHESLSRRARRDLEQMGVTVMTGRRVTKIDSSGVWIDGNSQIHSKTVIWAAGVQAAKLRFSENLEMDRSGRVFVDKDFSLTKFPEVFVVGDMAAYRLSERSTLPGLAPVAKQAGQHAAQMIQRTLAKKERTPFRYLDKGQMATIGKRKAVAEIGSLRLTGLIAWLGWLLIHVSYLIGFKNKLSVLFQWTWSYIFEKRGSRLITSPRWKLDD